MIAQPTDVTEATELRISGAVVTWLEGDVRIWVPLHQIVTWLVWQVGGRGFLDLYVSIAEADKYPHRDTNGWYRFGYHFPGDAEAAGYRLEEALNRVMVP